MPDHNKKPKSPYTSMLHRSPCLNLDQLMAYAEDNVTERERFEIENHLADCGLCSDALEGLISYEAKKNIPQTINELNKKIHDSGSSQIAYKSNWKAYYSLAAVLVIALISILYFQVKEPPYESLYMEYFKPYPNMIPLVRGDESAGELESAMVEYEIENYQESIRILQNLLDKKPGNDIANFYAGISCLCLNDPKVAIIYLQKVIDDEKSELTDRATWYIGLAYLKEKDAEAAETSFHKLSSKEGNYKERSTELLNRLK